MNWRRWAITALLKASGSRVPAHLTRIKKLEFSSKNQLNAVSESKLEELVDYCYKFVPYYGSVLERCEVIVNGGVRLENFQNIPPLTKQIIRDNREALLPIEYKVKGRYENTSGGSTGEPVRFYQDSRYEDWNTANKLYFNSVLGKQPGDKEIKLWGSDRDIIKGSLGPKDNIINFLYNRRFFNCYRLGKSNLENLRLLNNSFKPCGYWSYMEAAVELADYATCSGKYFHPPKMIVSTIGPLTEELRDRIQSSLGCDVYNQYGSREVGAIACECREKSGLHTFPWSHCVEVVDDEFKPVGQGQEGQILVTALENHAMPMLRYSIGDVGVSGGHDCGCGRNSFKLAAVKGRTLGYFIKSDGSKVHSHFIVQGLFFRDWIERFQVTQEAINHIVISVMKRVDVNVKDTEIEDIKEQCRILMGQDCCIDVDFVIDIPRSKSGKFVYTVCKVVGDE